MQRLSRLGAAPRLLVLAAAACSACAGAVTERVGASPTPGPAPAAAGKAGATPRHTAADTRFMQGMIGHHSQALAMTTLVPSRTERREVRLIAERIEVSQRDEIALMRSWLDERGEPTPAEATSDAAHGAAGDEHAGHDMGGMHDAAAAHAAMPGMITPEHLAGLAAARGPAFDRLFLEHMIRHHEGALTMVAQLLASPGAAQSSDTYAFVSDVETDQRAEIARMRALLASMKEGGGE